VLNLRRFRTHAEAWMVNFEWIEGCYNPHSQHSDLVYLSPINFIGECRIKLAGTESSTHSLKRERSMSA
jgi:hypothetical protein